MGSKQGKWAIFLIIAMTICSSIAFAVGTSEPEGTGTLTVVNSTRRTSTAASSKPAYAGNVSLLTITGEAITQSWQGYYGNVSGKVTLDDSTGRTLYEWNLSSPEGEVYAANITSLNWAQYNIKCYNYTTGAGDGFVYLEQLETAFGIETHDIDGINETFVAKPQGGSNTFYHDQFYVGQNYIDGEEAPCPVVYLFTNNETNVHNTSVAGSQFRHFQEVILYSTSNNQVIWTSLLDEEAVHGFQDGEADFEMIVPENGHDGNAAVTNYYFWVELE